MHGQDDFARAVFRDEDRGYWAQALPIVLEKHGLLDVQESGPSILADRAALERFDAVLVARLPDGGWPADLAGELAGRDTGTCAFVEGLAPPQVRTALGIDAAVPAANEASFEVLEPSVCERLEAIGLAPTVEIRNSRSVPVARDPELEWTNVASLGIDDAHADAWRASGWDAEAWPAPVDDREVLGEWVAADGGRSPAILRRGCLFAASFGLFTFLAQKHTSAPCEAGHHRTSPARVLALELLLLELIDRMHRIAGRPRRRVLPWPDGKQWALSIRHDYDRPMEPQELEAVVGRHERAGTAATWYWRRGLVDEIGPVRDQPRHEVALHTELMWFDPDEYATVAKAAGRDPAGAAAHGAVHSCRYQGAPNVIWADEQGLAYTEMLEHFHLHPHRFAALESDGRIRILDAICLPHHESFEDSSGGTYEDAILARLSVWSEPGGLLQLMNHPDKNGEEIFELVAKLPRDVRLDWTAEEAVEWWRATHVQGADAEHVDGATIEVLHPDGSAEQFVIRADASGRASARSAQSWEDVSAIYADALLEYHAARGRPADAPATVRNIRSNTELVPRRADRLLALLEQTTGATPHGRRLLEVGCGFGALSNYIAWKAQPDELVAIDIRDDYLELAMECASRAGLADRVTFKRGDMRDLVAASGDRFDFVLCNNALEYVMKPADIRTSLQQFHNALRPGGWVLLYEPNRWRRTDPFTGDPYTHLLPGPLRGPFTRVTGWKHSRDRVRTISTTQARRWVEWAGLGDVKVLGFRGSDVFHRGMHRFFADAYALAARRPE